MVKNNYKKMLEMTYEENKKASDSCDYEMTFGNFLSNIFDIVTYDDEKDEYFCKMIMEVVEVILNRTNFEYLINKTNYERFLTVVNFQFIKTKIEWGTSIRGCFFDCDKDFVIEPPFDKGFAVKAVDVKTFFQRFK